MHENRSFLQEYVFRCKNVDFQEKGGISLNI